MYGEKGENGKALTFESKLPLEDSMLADAAQTLGLGVRRGHLFYLAEAC